MSYQKQNFANGRLFVVYKKAAVAITEGGEKT